MKRNLRNSVVVITGASSGIGHATALEFARRGANLVLAARREQALQRVAQECERLGVQAIAVATDVSDEAAIDNLASRAITRFGRIDIWINNAGVYMLGEFTDTPTESIRRLTDINYFGVVNGCKAALRHMRPRGSGVIINTSSQAGKMAYRYASAYCASKFAVRALSDALRQELFDTNIDVCVVLPTSTDTPLFHETANYAGRKIKPMEPISSAREVAEVIVRLAQTRERESYVGATPRVLDAMHTLSPAAHDHLMAKQTEAKHFEDVPASPSEGNLFMPDIAHTGISGGWKQPEKPGRAGKNIGVAAAIALPAIAGFVLWNRNRTQRAEESWRAA